MNGEMLSKNKEGEMRNNLLDDNKYSFYIFWLARTIEISMIFFSFVVHSFEHLCIRIIYSIFCIIII